VSGVSPWIEGFSGLKAMGGAGAADSEAQDPETPAFLLASENCYPQNPLLQ